AHTAVRLVERSLAGAGILARAGDGSGLRLAGHRHGRCRPALCGRRALSRVRSADAASRLAVAARLAMARRYHLVSHRSRPARLPGTSQMTASVAIVDYGAGNLRSASKAFERAVRSIEA